MRKDFPTLDRCVSHQLSQHLTFRLTLRPLFRSDTLVGVSLPALISTDDSSTSTSPILDSYHAYSFTGNDSLTLVVESVQDTPFGGNSDHDR